MTELIKTMADQNCFGYYETVMGSSDASEAFEKDGVLITNAGLGVQNFNVAFITKNLSNPSDSIRGFIDYYGDKKQPFIVRVPIDLDPYVSSTLNRLGLETSSPVLSMAMSMPAGETNQSVDLEINVVTGDESFDEHRRTCALGFGVPEIESVMSSDLVDHPSSTWFTGYVNSQPVATSLLFQTGKMAGIYNVATLKEFRRRGIGEAMTRAAVNAGRANGSEYACLQPSGLGEPIYKRMGFKTISRYQNYKIVDTEPVVATESEET